MMNKYLFFIMCFFVVLINGCSKNPDVTTTTSLTLRGVNIAGAELAYGKSNTDSPVVNKDYLMVSREDCDYLASKNINFVRFLISWEGLQKSLYAPLSFDTEYGSTLLDRVNYLTSKNINVMLEPHGGFDTNFARYKGNLVGSTAVPNAAFADFWKRMAEKFKSNPRVIFGLSNEPNQMSTVQWFSAAQAAIDGIRSTGSTAMIMVPGNGWSNPVGWDQTWNDTASVKTTSAKEFVKLKDPLNNIVASVHSYFNANGGGTADDIVSPTIGVERLKPMVTWARTNKVKIHLSEFGANLNAPNAQLAVKNLLDFINDNSDVVIGWAWWTYGPSSWWQNYTFTLARKSTTEDPKWLWLNPFVVKQVNVLPSVDAASPVLDSSTDSSVDSSLDASKDSSIDSALDASKDSSTDASVNSSVDSSVMDSGIKDASADVVKLVLSTNTRITYDWTAGYCAEVDVINSNKSDVSWESFTLDLSNSKIRDTNKQPMWDTWGGMFPGRSGMLLIKPMSWNKTVKAGTKATVGFCADRLVAKTMPKVLELK